MNYMGSKSKLASHLYNVIRPHRGEKQWVEPFVGGANFIQWVSGVRWGNDSNRFLIACLVALQEGWRPDYITEEEFDDIKANKDTGKYPDHVIGWTLTACTYRTVWNAGFSRPHTTAKGEARDIQRSNLNRVVGYASKLWGIRFTAGSYLDMDIPDTSLVYCDPPYFQTGKYEGGFDHQPFYEWLIERSARQMVFVSEYTCPPEFVQVWQHHRKTDMAKTTGKVERLFVHERFSNLF